mmetsp:Transcript_52737/g.60613  ORF Transcript_52737/g.60613 Transcript_52737/m.60613 type:complete len:252 (-) Transcript_52737:169-924(-)
MTAATHPRHPDAVPVDHDVLKHRYVIMRHGFSVPNEARRIVSSMELGSRESYGLTPVGQQQAAKSAVLLANSLLRDESLTPSRPVVIFSSPFSRALQTANIARDTLVKHGVGVQGSVRVCPQLRERFFGDLDGLSDENYARVWAKDAADGDHQTAFNAESCLSVWLRVHQLIQLLEACIPDPSTVILVSHGDTLQITQTAMLRRQGGVDAKAALVPLSSHRSLEPLMQAEWRLVGGPALPDPSLGVRSSKL